MHLCGICIENVECPSALPCGHIFCSGCLSRTVDAIRPYSTLHCCPTCRARYSVVSIDPALFPHHVTPSIRRLYLDQPAPLPAPISSVTDITKEKRSLLAENSALRTNCEMWRKRAEAHGGVTLKLLDLLHVLRYQASQAQREQNELKQRYNVLKRKLNVDDP
ncbi:hypothetical protein L208DRAFT_358346 [Tricholoma matsutake]|nr:hypothetical protein L208DRAFT_358346 [Tricholoma matsutake 945]